MSEREGYEPGVPCWVASVAPGPGGDASFGWDRERFDTGGGQITLGRAPGYVGGEPRQPVSRVGVVGRFVVPGFRRAVLAGPQGAAFPVSRLAVPARGA